MTSDTGFPGRPGAQPEDPRERVQQYVAAWRDSTDSVLALLRSLEPAEWDLPTQCPGWDVRAVAAHLAHLESELAGNPQDEVEVPEAPHIRGLMGQFTEAGPIARREWPTARIVDELERSTAARWQELTHSPPDPAATAPGFAGLIGWTNEHLLGNRGVDMWVHEQDIRTATGRVGGLESLGARHVGGVFARALPFVLGKKVHATAGQSVVLELTAPLPFHEPCLVAAAVGDDGRGALLEEAPESPTTRLTLSFHDWTRLSGGRCASADTQFEVSGDEALAVRVVDNLAVTP